MIMSDDPAIKLVEELNYDSDYNFTAPFGGNVWDYFSATNGTFR